MKEVNYILKKYADQIGISGSVICLLHCIFFPLLGILSTGATTEIHSHTHLFIGDEFIFIIIGLFAVFFSARNIESKLIKTLLWFFVMVFTISLLISELSQSFSWVTYIAHISALGLIFTHAYNFYKLRKLNQCRLT